MKICVIAPSYLPARRANTIQTMKMAQAMQQAGHEVQVTVPAAPDQPVDVDWETLATQYGLSTRFEVSWLPVSARLRGYDYGWRAVQWAQQAGADLILTRLPQAAWLASWRGPDVVFEAHDIPRGRLGSWLFPRMISGRHFRRLVVITHALRAAINGTYDLRAIDTLVEPDGVDLERYSDLPTAAAARAALGDAYSLPDRFTAGYSGHLYPGRGAEVLLHLAQRLPEINVLVVGGEPADVERLRQQAALIGLENVQLTGFVPNAELPRYQAACEVLLMPYQRRVAASSGGDIGRFLSPMKLFEYLACGRVIMSSDLPVLQEVLSEQNAILLPPDDLDAWEVQLAGVAADPEAYDPIAEQARATAARFTWAERVERIIGGA
jgi:glycosyltransferase involved in cell wall biosynthesis